MGAGEKIGYWMSQILFLFFLVSKFMVMTRDLTNQYYTMPYKFLSADGHYWLSSRGHNLDLMSVFYIHVNYKFEMCLFNIPVMYFTNEIEIVV